MKKAKIQDKFNCNFCENIVQSILEKTLLFKDYVKMTITPINNNILPATLASGANAAMQEATKQSTAEDNFKANFEVEATDISSQTRPVEETTNEESKDQARQEYEQLEMKAMMTRIAMNVYSNKQPK